MLVFTFEASRPIQMLAVDDTSMPAPPSSGRDVEAQSYSELGVWAT
jgi:hypothetical protein